VKVCTNKATFTVPISVKESDTLAPNTTYEIPFVANFDMFFDQLAKMPTPIPSMITAIMEIAKKRGVSREEVVKKAITDSYTSIIKDWLSRQKDIQFISLNWVGNTLWFKFKTGETPSITDTKVPSYPSLFDVVKSIFQSEIGTPAPVADLVLDEFSISPTTPKIGDTVTVKFAVRNKGMGSGNVKVGILKDTMRIYEKTLNVRAGGIFTDSFTTKIEKDRHVFIIYVWLEQELKINISKEIIASKASQQTVITQPYKSTVTPLTVSTSLVATPIFEQDFGSLKVNIDWGVPPFKYTINWGDGTTDSGTIDKTPYSTTYSHKYTKSGIYTISFTASDGFTTKTSSQTITVYPRIPTGVGGMPTLGIPTPLGVIGKPPEEIVVPYTSKGVTALEVKALIAAETIALIKVISIILGMILGITGLVWLWINYAQARGVHEIRTTVKKEITEAGVIIYDDKTHTSKRVKLYPENEYSKITGGGLVLSVKEPSTETDVFLVSGDVCQLKWIYIRGKLTWEHGIDIGHEAVGVNLEMTGRGEVISVEKPKEIHYEVYRVYSPELREWRVFEGYGYETNFEVQFPILGIPEEELIRALNYRINMTYSGNSYTVGSYTFLKCSLHVIAPKIEIYLDNEKVETSKKYTGVSGKEVTVKGRAFVTVDQPAIAQILFGAEGKAPVDGASVTLGSTKTDTNKDGYFEIPYVMPKEKTTTESFEVSSEKAGFAFIMGYGVWSRVIYSKRATIIFESLVPEETVDMKLMKEGKETTLLSIKKGEEAYLVLRHSGTKFNVLRITVEGLPKGSDTYSVPKEGIMTKIDTFKEGDFDIKITKVVSVDGIDIVTSYPSVHLTITPLYEKLTILAKLYKTPYLEGNLLVIPILIACFVDTQPANKTKLKYQAFIYDYETKKLLGKGSEKTRTLGANNNGVIYKCKITPPPAGRKADVYIHVEGSWENLQDIKDYKIIEGVHI
jgi:hypothetical protein